ALGGLGRYMADRQARAGARETPVGDERALRIEAASLQERRRLEHLLHSRAALRPFVADQHDVARSYTVAEDAFARCVLALEDDHTPAKAQQLRVDAGGLHDAALLGKVAVQHREPAVGA